MWTVVVLQKEASAGSGRWTPLMHGLDEFAHGNGTTPVFLFVFLIFFFFKSLSALRYWRKNRLFAFIFVYLHHSGSVWRGDEMENVSKF